MSAESEKERLIFGKGGMSSGGLTGGERPGDNTERHREQHCQGELGLSLSQASGAFLVSDLKPQQITIEMLGVGDKCWIVLKTGSRYVSYLKTQRKWDSLKEIRYS